MRVFCDVRIPYRLVNRLRELGVDATHVNRLLEGSRTSDGAIAISNCPGMESHGCLNFVKPDKEHGSGA